MTPQEKCVAVLAALAQADVKGSLAVASAEIDAFVQAVGGGNDMAARALDELAFKLSVSAPATDTAVEIGDEIRRKIEELGFAPNGRPHPI